MHEGGDGCGYKYTVKSPNKRHFGEPLSSFDGRLSSLGDS